MLDSVRQIDDRSQTNGVLAHALPRRPTEQHSLGFTAVNGNIQTSDAVERSASKASIIHRPILRIAMTDNVTQSQTIEGPTTREADLRPISDLRNGTRSPDDVSIGSKRKRNSIDDIHEQDVRNGVSADAGSSSPKRRWTAPDSGIDVTSPDRQHILTPVYSRDRSPPGVMSSSQYERARTPVREKNAPGPPPPISEKTTAELAQLAQEMNSSEHSESSADSSRGDITPAPQGAPSQSTGSAPAGSPEPLDNTNNSGDKQRKRGFTHRTKTGCHTCRTRKKKCDENKPICGNCQRGGFNCLGYGAKPDNAKQVLSRGPAILHAKYDHARSLSQHDPHPRLDSHPYDHWRTMSQPLPPTPLPLPPPEPRGSYVNPPVEGGRQYPPNHDHWQGPRPPWPPQDPPFHMQERLPPADFQHMVPLGSMPREHQHQHQHQSPQPQPHQQQHPPPPPHSYPHPPQPFTQHLQQAPQQHQQHPQHLHQQQHQHQPPPPFPPPAHPPQWQSQQHGSSYEPPRRPPSGPSSMTAPPSRSALSSSLHMTAPVAMPYGESMMSDKDKMLLGKPYKSDTDRYLIYDRDSCKLALEQYNEALRPWSGVTDPEKVRLFQKIVDRALRTKSGDPNERLLAKQPTGSIGTRSIVSAPFHCDYGYNIHIGSNVTIGSHCYMQDPCTITIGDRTSIGSNVGFYGVLTNVDPRSREGRDRVVSGGTITVEEGCDIGAGAIILGWRTIGKGATVGAGAVVTTNVPPYTVVAGNPAKEIRTITPGQGDARHSSRIQKENDEAREAHLRNKGHRE